jgi:hypothetical protein
MLCTLKVKTGTEAFTVGDVGLQDERQELQYPYVTSLELPKLINQTY